jgi:hypothetical protein
MSVVRARRRPNGERKGEQTGDDWGGGAGSGNALLAFSCRFSASTFSRCRCCTMNFMQMSEKAAEMAGLTRCRKCHAMVPSGGCRVMWPAANQEREGSAVKSTRSARSQPRGKRRSAAHTQPKPHAMGRANSTPQHSAGTPSTWGTARPHGRRAAPTKQQLHGTLEHVPEVLRLQHGEHTGKHLQHLPLLLGANVRGAAGPHTAACAP